jgi:hypothetical protein
MEKFIRNVKTNLGGTIFSATGQCLLCVDDVAIADKGSEVYFRSSGRRMSFKSNIRN